MDADEIGFGIMLETYSLNVFVPQKKGLAYAMHAIHHSAVVRKDNRKGEIAIGYQTRVLNYVATRHVLGAFI